MTRRWARAVTAVAVVVVLAASCSGGDDDTAPDASPGSPSTTTVDPAALPEGIVGLCPGEEFADAARSVALPRDLPDGSAETVAMAEIESLVAGLTPSEAAAGVLVPWPDGVEGILRGVSLEGGTLTVDFDRGVIDTYIAAPGTSKPFFVPLVETAFRQPEVQRLDMVINGSVEEWVEWWQGEASFDRETWRERSPEPAASCPTS